MPLVAFLAALALGVVARAWMLAGRDVVVWADSRDLLATSRSSWTSLGLWAGPRPPGVPVVLKVLGGDLHRAVVVQAGLAAACWAALCASVATVVAGRGRRVAAVAAVLAFSVTTPVTMWDRSVLSESPGLSLLALVVAAGVQLARGVTGWRVALVVGAGLPWLALRDTHLAVAVTGGSCALAAAAWPGARGGCRPLAALGAVAVALGLLAGLGASHGERHTAPVRHVLSVRVLPYPDRVRWFAGHGMPQAGEFLGPDRRVPVAEPGRAPVVPVAEGDPRLGAWLAWARRHGRQALARFVATHPAYLVTEPLRDPERTFNDAGGDRSFYAAPDHPHLVPVDAVLARRTGEVLAAGALVLATSTGRRWRSPALVAGLATALLALPHGAVAWHGDGMEAARHLVVPAVQLHLGVLLLVVGRLAPARPRPGPAPGARYVRPMADETPLSIAHPTRTPFGGVVVLQEVFGVTPHIEDVCQRLADAGWLAVAPHLFHRTGDPVLPYDDFSQVAPHVAALGPGSVLEDVDAALAFLDGAGFPADACGVVGFCAGGSMAMFAAAERELGAAVTYYGGGVVEGRFGLPPLLELAPRLRTPWLGLYGDDDEGIPVDQVEQLAAAAATAPVPTEVVRYPGAGHAFNRDGWPTYVEEAARDAWMRTLDWFADNLTTGASEAG